MLLLWLRQLPWCGNQTPASIPPPVEGRSNPTNTPVFPLVPSSYLVLRGPIYSFPLVRYSCPSSAGVLNALLGLKVYSWCIHGERCTPCPPTPLPSCSLHYFLLIKLFSLYLWVKNVSKLGVLSHPKGRDFPQILGVSAGPVACNSAYFVQTELALPPPKLGHARSQNLRFWNFLLWLWVINFVSTGTIMMVREASVMPVGDHWVESGWGSRTAKALRDEVKANGAGLNQGSSIRCKLTGSPIWSPSFGVLGNMRAKITLFWGVKSSELREAPLKCLVISGNVLPELDFRVSYQRWPSITLYTWQSMEISMLVNDSGAPENQGDALR